ncbi:MAG: threonylcarbamoyl-AMP synthase [Clostridia bacterium]|nr:threonylcarbamoyl-AMP synthase [Clostridia bacterium]
METRILKIDAPDDEKIKLVGEILREGGLAAIPTETVYGLAGNALRGECAKRIFEAKGRPSDNPLIVHISSFDEWAPLVKEIPETAKALADAFWPGPLTIILPKSDLVPDEVSGKLPTVAVRMPGNEIARAIIDSAGVPLAAPSANLSGKPSPTSAKHVIDDMNGKIDVIVDSGECTVGVESTVISLAVNPPRLLRPGGITPEMLTSVLGEIEIDDAVFNKLPEGAEAASPGMKYKHYAPAAQVVLIKSSLTEFVGYVEKNKSDGTVALCFEGEEKGLTVPCLTYGRKNDPSSQAKQIFDALRRLDEIKAEKVFARLPEKDGVGLAVFNRLIRAAGFNVIEL